VTGTALPVADRKLTWRGGGLYTRRIDTGYIAPQPGNDVEGSGGMSVRHGMLALLERRSMHGYELRRELENDLGPEWAVNYGQVYSTLERLVRDRLVVQSDTVPGSDAPDRKLHTLTPAGRSELRQWFLTPVGGGEVRRDELFAKVILGLTSDVDVDEVIQVQRKSELRRMGELTATKESRDLALDLPEVLQIDMEILRTEATIRWLDAAEVKIHKAAEETPEAVPLRESFAVAALRDVEEIPDRPQGAPRGSDGRDQGRQ
jgi:DNA-binding PadR family transcriptional regulator